MHTTALCSPTRSCILTGRNHHSNGMACITEGSTGFPGGNGVIPFENGFLSEMLLAHGYNTYCVGKWHLTPAEQISAAGPYDRWPLGRGFERYYGFLGGDTSQYYPDLVYDNHQVDPASTPEEGYHLTEDLTNKAIQFIADAKQLAPDKPFFLYFATGAQHAPHQVPKEWADRYQGKFDEGWDAYRERGPGQAEGARHRPEEHGALAARPGRPGLGQAPGRREEALRAHDGGLRRLPRAHRPPHRPADRLPRRASGELDNTLIMLISDNGASSEGGPTGSTNENKFFNNVPEDLKAEPRRARRPRGAQVLQSLRVGLDVRRQHAVPPLEAGDLPRRRVRSLHRPLAAGIKARGEIRPQYAHAIDMVPTVLDALGIEPPAQIRGVTQSPIEGVSFRHTFDDAGAESQPQDAVLRDVRPPGALPRRLARGVPVPRARPSPKPGRSSASSP